MRRRARAEPTSRVREEQTKHQAQRQKGPKKNRRKPGSREMNSKKIPEEKALLRRQFLRLSDRR
ncbi:hypothetical protein FSO04_17370 [Paraburkholderia madseniana]|jgi:hypothetical protein|uniref:Uncharacterized protein n=1 Tax=Paraburkholderia madseniana TaxID=2599607 RepID=A0A6N6WDS2_9BURK|nr:hypothetical protein [Paraburkholderia madseniana]KAE8758663.1 hypothetical protein FSO04_17370 [Paraburkholderia madseniana]